MATTVHHAVAKKAQKHGIRIQAVADGLFSGTDLTNEEFRAEGEDAKKVLDEILAMRKPAKAAKRVKGPKPAKVTKPRKAKKEDEDGDEDGTASEDDEPEGDEDGTASGDDEPEDSGSIVKSKYRAKYAESTVKDTNDDDLAHALAKYLTVDEALDVRRLAQVAKDNDIVYAKYESHNPGHRRMIVGNILRGKHRKGTDVKIGSQTIKGKKQ